MMEVIPILMKDSIFDNQAGEQAESDSAISEGTVGLQLQAPNLHLEKHKAYHLYTLSGVEPLGDLYDWQLASVHGSNRPAVEALWNSKTSFPIVQQEGRKSRGSYHNEDLTENLTERNLSGAWREIIDSSSVRTTKRK